MENKIIVHVSEVKVSPQSGMGRIEYHWKEALEKKGFKFIHIGPEEVGPLRHQGLFPFKAFAYYKQLNINPTAFIVHEPSSGYFVNKNVPVFLESHGIERRYWEAQLNGSVPPPTTSVVALKTKILFPLWRLRGCDKGLKNATKLLLSNSDDKEYAKTKYTRSADDILVFKNGVTPFTGTATHKVANFTVLFNATWQERKGIKILIKAAELLHLQGLKINYLLIGTSTDGKTVLNDWPDRLKPFVEVVSRFKSDDELMYLASSSLFVLPSYFEGQPLSLLQAMAAGKCCVTTNSCGQKDVINDNKTGLLFEVGDFEQLASIISKCYHDPDMVETIGFNAKQYAEGLTWQKVSTEVADFLISNI